jgi:hypothetical protein
LDASGKKGSTRMGIHFLILPLDTRGAAGLHKMMQQLPRRR